MDFFYFCLKKTTMVWICQFQSLNWHYWIQLSQYHTRETENKQLNRGMAMATPVLPRKQTSAVIALVYIKKTRKALGTVNWQWSSTITLSVEHYLKSSLRSKEKTEICECLQSTEVRGRRRETHMDYCIHRNRMQASKLRCTLWRSRANISHWDK